MTYRSMKSFGYAVTRAESGTFHGSLSDACWSEIGVDFALLSLGFVCSMMSKQCALVAFWDVARSIYIRSDRVEDGFRVKKTV
jgi:hypothetical protein